MSPDTTPRGADRKGTIIRGEWIFTGESSRARVNFPGLKIIATEADRLYRTRKSHSAEWNTRTRALVTSDNHSRRNPSLSLLLPIRDRKNVVSFRFVNPKLPADIVAVETVVLNDPGAENILFKPVVVAGSKPEFDQKQCLLDLEDFLSLSLTTRLQEQIVVMGKWSKWQNI